MLRCLASLLAALLATSALAGTPRHNFNYSNDAEQNSNLDKVDTKLPTGNVVTSFRHNGNGTTLDFASAAANTCSTDLTVAITGAALGDVCSVGVPNGSVNTGSSFTCWVSAANTVSVRHCNTSAAANDPASGTFKVLVEQQ
jgi:hypothetical protein